MIRQALTLLAATTLATAALAPAALGQLAAATPAANNDAKPFEGHQVLRLTAHSSRDLLAVSSIATTILNCNIGIGIPLDVQVTPAQRAAIDGLRIPYEVTVQNLQALLDAEREQIRIAHLQRDNTWFNTYRTLAEFNAFMTQLATTYPTFASTFTTGQSLEARGINGIRVSAPDQPGNLRANRPIVLITGGQHAREWVNPATSIFMAHAMLEGYATDPRIHNILDHVELVVIPILNVDGYEYTWIPANRLWRKNRRDNGDGTFGVDLNRNWGYQFGGPGSSAATNNETYKGTAAFSEPETAVVRDFIIANPRMKASVDFHSYGQLILSPWGYTATRPGIDAGLFDRFNSEWQSEIYSVSQRTYRAGPTYTTIYPASGVAQDWAYGDRGILSWGVELRAGSPNGFILDAAQILPTCQENLPGILGICESMLLPAWLSIQDPLPQWASTSAGTPISVVTRDNIETVNPTSVKVYERVAPGATFTAHALTPSATAGIYPYTLTPPPCGKFTDFYIEATTTLGSIIRYPANAPASTLAIRSAETLTSVSFDGQTDAGWSISAPGDTATAGRWQRGVPTSTNYQPAAGVTGSGTSCWFTGLPGGGSNANDLDGGTTTLTSALFNTNPPSGRTSLQTTLTYWRWFGTNQNATTGPDSLIVSITANDGQTWQQLENVNFDTRAWNSTTTALPGPVPTSTRTRLRFVATDGGPDSTVEAGADDVSVLIRHCRKSSDMNGDGGVGIEDLLLYLEAFDAGTLPADYTNDDGVGIEDLLLYLDTYSDGY